MSGAIIPEPLAKPAIVTGTPSSSTFATAPFGKVSVVMIARAAGSAVARARSAASLPEHRDDPLGRQRLADHAGRGHEDMRLGHAQRRGRGAPPSPCTAARPAPPVKALELPELTRKAKPPSPAAAAQRGQPLLAPEHRRRAGRRPGEDPGDRRRPARSRPASRRAGPGSAPRPRPRRSARRRSAAAPGSRPRARAARPAASPSPPCRWRPALPRRSSQLVSRSVSRIAAAGVPVSGFSIFAPGLQLGELRLQRLLAQLVLDLRPHLPRAPAASSRACR